jgi:Tol biopolymer transport system component
VKAVAVNPNQTNDFVFASALVANGPVRLYRGNSSLNAAGATQLTSLAHEVITDIQFSPDGASVLFLAKFSGDSEAVRLYIVPSTGGTATVIDQEVSGFSVLQQTGQTKVVYAKGPSAFELFVRDYATGTSSTQITNVGSADLPRWNRTGTRIIFLADGASSGNYDIFSVAPTGGTVTPLIGTTEVEGCAMLNGTDTLLGYTTQSLGVYVANADGTNPQRIKISGQVDPSFIYFTNAAGRSRTGEAFSYNVGKRNQRNRR